MIMTSINSVKHITQKNMSCSYCIHQLNSQLVLNSVLRFSALKFHEL